MNCESLDLEALGYVIEALEKWYGSGLLKTEIHNYKDDDKLTKTEVIISKEEM
jgi:hypothetical protein